MKTWLRHVGAELFVVRARTLRTRALILPFALVGASVILALQASPETHTGVTTIWVVVLGAVAVGYVAGADEDRLSFQLILTHPTRPSSVAIGRWVGALAIAAAAYLAGATALALAAPNASDISERLLGLIPLAALTAVTLTASWVGGAAGATLIVVSCLFVGSIPPDSLSLALGGGRLAEMAAAAFHLLPTLHRVREAITGEAKALAIAGGWIAIGLVAATSVLARRAAWPGDSR